MQYLLFEILIFLILSFALGFATSWALWGRSAKGSRLEKTERKLSTSQARVRDLERQVELLQSQRKMEAVRPTAPAPPASPPPAPRPPASRPSTSAPSGPAAAAFLDDDLPRPFRPLTNPPPTPAPPTTPRLDPPAVGPPPAEDKPSASRPSQPKNESGPYDDLQRISGIGPVIVSQLAELGVTTYRQIALFTDEDIERVGQHLDVFPDRVRREQWVAQAADLHRQTYGTQP